jgi:TolB-like protein/Tfp pilus assembly protein PilF
MRPSRAQNHHARLAAVVGLKLVMKSFLAELNRRNVIRVAVFYGAGSWLLLQVADVLLEIIDAPDGSLRLIAAVLALGFPFALILAWVFEITPEGVKRESELDRSQPAGQAGRKLDIATIALLVLAIGVLAWDRFAGRPADTPAVAERAAPADARPGEAPRDLSIGVLPFVNMSVDPENEYFSEGLSEELLNVLAKIDDFRVAGRTSSFAFKGQNQDLRAIGERLGVANILEGSVRKQGDRVRVTAQLVDTRSGYHLWSDTYDRQLDDIFAIQDEIATEVVRALRLALLPADAAVIRQTAKGDVEAYNHYLRGQFHVRLRTRAGLDRALEEFQQSILVDPDYAPPYAGIAMVYALLDNYGYRSLTETHQLANRALQRALELDPQSDEAWAVRGLLISQAAGARQRRPEARAALERAVEINPNNAMAHLWLSGTLGPDYDAARAALTRAYDLDPLSPIIVYRRAMDALQSRDESAMARFHRELEEVAPDWFITWQATGNMAEEAGRLAEAAQAYERVIALNPESSHAKAPLAKVLEMMGYVTRAEAILSESVERFGGDPFRLALAVLQVRRVLQEDGFGPAADAFHLAIAGMEESTGETEALLALLEIGAGRIQDAEARLLAAIEPEGGRKLTAAEPHGALLRYVLALLRAEQGRKAELRQISTEIRDVFRDMQAQGVSASYMPMVEGVLDNLQGEPEALATGLNAALEMGFRMPPADLIWLMPVKIDAAERDRAMASMAEVLAEERRRYDSAKAGA